MSEDRCLVCGTHEWTTICPLCAADGWTDKRVMVAIVRLLGRGR